MDPSVICKAPIKPFKDEVVSISVSLTSPGELTTVEAQVNKIAFVDVIPKEVSPITINRIPSKFVPNLEDLIQILSHQPPSIIIGFSFNEMRYLVEFIPQ